MLYNEAKVNTRFRNLHHAQTQRAAPRFWKNGPKKGKVRIPGITSLPYLWSDLKQHTIEILGMGATRCNYCVQIGRPANLIDIVSCHLDHIVPLARGGQWTLENLYPCCAECNKAKGSLSQETFIGVMGAIYKLEDERDRIYLLRCLNTQGTVMATWTGRGKPTNAKSLPEPAAPKQRLLAEEF